MRFKPHVVEQQVKLLAQTNKLYCVRGTTGYQVHSSLYITSPLPNVPDLPLQYQRIVWEHYQALPV